MLKEKQQMLCLFNITNRYQRDALGRQVTCRMISLLEFSPHSEKIE